MEAPSTPAKVSRSPAVTALGCVSPWSDGAAMAPGSVRSSWAVSCVCLSLGARLPSPGFMVSESNPWFCLTRPPGVSPAPGVSTQVGSSPLGWKATGTPGLLLALASRKWSPWPHTELRAHPRGLAGPGATALTSSGHAQGPTSIPAPSTHA